MDSLTSKYVKFTYKPSGKVYAGQVINDFMSSKSGQRTLLVKLTDDSQQAYQLTNPHRSFHMSKMDIIFQA